MSGDLIWPFLMSPESTLFFPGSATAVPPRASRRAVNATAIEGDGYRRAKRFMRPPWAGTSRQPATVVYESRADPLRWHGQMSRVLDTCQLTTRDQLIRPS